MVCLLLVCFLSCYHSLSIIIEFTTRSTWLLESTFLTVGLSLTPPLCLRHPKYFSIGSCEILSLRKLVTPGIVNMYFIRSVNEWAAMRGSRKCHFLICTYLLFLCQVGFHGWEVICSFDQMWGLCISWLHLPIVEAKAKRLCLTTVILISNNYPFIIVVL